MDSDSSQKFGRFRSLFCPVHKSELKLFLPLLLIFFFICLTYNILRTIKDPIVITAPSAGAEVIPFIKVWAILPAALFMTALFTRLSNRFKMEKVFYTMMGIFLSFFVLFCCVLYPLRDSLHPHAFADQLETILPLGCKGFVALLRNWTYTAFYVMAEMWSTMIMSILFWSFANEILNVHVAKRFYVLILIGGNLSAIAAGGTSSFVSGLGISWGAIHSIDPWQCSLFFLTSVIVLSGLVVVGIFRWLHKNILNNHFFSHQLSPKEEKASFKMGLRKNFKYLAKSKYLLCLATIVIVYNICINLTEVTWKDQICQNYPNPNDFTAYQGKVTMWIGIVATLIAFSSATLIRKWSWTANAMLPPLLLLITGIGFFTFLLCKELPLGIAIASFLGSTPAMVGVFFGSLQNCFSRASKYTFFDATKELAFVPLSQESKLKGKAAIDGVASRVGKSGSALMYQALLMFLGTVSSTLPYVGAILLIAVAAWIVAVYSLGKQFNTLTEQKKSMEEQEKMSEILEIKEEVTT